MPRHRRWPFPLVSSSRNRACLAYPASSPPQHPSSWPPASRRLRVACQHLPAGCEMKQVPFSNPHLPILPSPRRGACPSPEDQRHAQQALRRIHLHRADHDQEWNRFPRMFEPRIRHYLRWIHLASWYRSLRRPTPQPAACGLLRTSHSMEQMSNWQSGIEQPRTSVRVWVHPSCRADGTTIVRSRTAQSTASKTANSPSRKNRSP